MKRGTPKCPSCCLARGSHLIHISKLKRKTVRSAKLRFVVAMYLAIATAGDAQKNVATEHRPDAVRVEMRNVTYHFTDSISVHIFRLEGELTSTTAGTIPVFDDKNSF